MAQHKFMRYYFTPLLLALLWTASSAQTAPIQSPADIAVWSVNEFIQSQRDVELAGKVPSQMLVRGWFKWANANNLTPLVPLLDACRARGQLFGGGITMSALYRRENGIDEATFMDFATRDPNNKLYPAFGKGDYFHGTLSNPKYLDHCLKWAFQQIDAGVDHLFMDEVDAAQGEHEGYDDYAIHEFRAWLLGRHADWISQNPVGRASPRADAWTPTDPRWTQTWRVPLTNSVVCPDGSMRTFDYRAFLQHHQATVQPWGEKNPLAVPWMQFKAERDGRAWRETCARIREYAAKKGKTVFIAANGLNRYVDHQIQGFWDQHLFLNSQKHVDASHSLLDWGCDLVRRSRTLLGRDVPIVVFHDWGFGMPWQNISVSDRNLWLKVYAPELYAAGVYFAFPVHGPFGCDSEKDGTLPTIIQQAKFFREHSDMFRVGARTPLKAAAVSAVPRNVTVRFEELPAANRRLLHLVNHNYADSNMTALSEFTVSLPSPTPPKAITVASPDFTGTRSISFESRAGRVFLRIPSLEYYDLVTLDYDSLPALPPECLDQDLVITPRGFWHKSPVSDFTISTNGLIENLDWINTYLQGKLHTHLHDEPAFQVTYATAGTFGVAVNSVATLGAILEIYLDDKLALREPLPDKDRRNDAAAQEINRTISIDVPPGRHVIRVANSGGDWLSIDRYILRQTPGGARK